MRVVEVDFRDPVKLLQNDLIWEAVVGSRHPACRRLARWVYHDVLPRVRRGQGYVWSGSPAELEAMMQAAVTVARRSIARRSRR